MLTLAQTADMAYELLALLGVKPAKVENLCADLGVTRKKISNLARELNHSGYRLMAHREKGKIAWLSLDPDGYSRAIADATEYVDSL